MLVIRFMLNDELLDYLEGKPLVNTSTHDSMRTTSKGFCFAEITPNRTTNKWMKKLCGIAACDWCVVFDAARFAKPLTESTGIYADDKDFEKCISVREWCTEAYSLDIFPYKAIGKVPSLRGMVMGEKITWVRPLHALTVLRELKKFREENDVL